MNYRDYLKKSAAEIKRVLELRRSNASTPIKSKRTYNRKPKHREDRYGYGDYQD
jgi:hypothetical protein